METILRVIGKDSRYEDIDNSMNFQPRKGDYIVHKGDSYIVEWIEYNFDNGTIYIIVKEN